MATNEALIEQIGKLAEELEKDTVETKDLNNADLAALAKELKTEKAGLDAAKKAEEDEAKAKAAAAKKKKDHPFKLAKGKAIACARGVLSDGDGISVDDLPGGKTRIDELIKSGHVVKA